MNLFDNDSTNSIRIEIKTGISANKSNIWKIIYKKSLIKDQTDQDIKFRNYSDFVYHFINQSTFQDKLILIINKNYLSKSKSMHNLEILLVNCNSKIICV